ncbi:MAG: CobQ/CobB/MinD/ParA nucleotide binding protein [Clostridia bacterium]|nr:CobQ/CobB/MinD/ParA nucleotide binding protein [Clostridia bacterium]
MIKLMIADENQSYVKALALYIQVEHGQAFEVTCFSKRKLLHEYLMSCEEADILLIDQKLLSEQVSVDQIKTVILLTEALSESNMTTIYKFQKAEHIIKLLLEAYDKSSSGKMIVTNSHCETKLLCAYSPAGAAGKSTIAYNLAHQYAMQSRKVLFLSFESFSSLPLLERGGQAKGIIFLLYLLKSQLPNLQLKLNTIKAVDANTNIHFIERESNVLEYKDIKMEDIELLTGFLKKQSGYDVIIFDMDTAMNEMTLGTFKYCDAIINISCSDRFGKTKQEDFFKQIPKINDLLEADISSKLINVINKYRETNEKNRCSEGLVIPYINDSGINDGVYFSEMTYFKQLYDKLENFFLRRWV